jgi:hypothetical protein
MMAVRALNKVRYKAGVMCKGLLATEEIKRLNYNVILVDVQMHCAGRREATKKISQTSKNSESGKMG